MKNRVYYNENEPFAAAWLRELIKAGHIAPGEVDERSIVDVQPEDLAAFTQCHFFAGIGVWSHALRAAGWPDDRPIWTGSCPCQPFSAAGKAAGTEDERHLWPAFHRLIDACRPPVVIGEQVASALVVGRAGGKVKAEDGPAWLDAVFDDLEGSRYACGAVVFPAAGVGAPHIRDRLYWLANADQQQRHGSGHAGAAGRGEPANLRAGDGLADAERLGREVALLDAGGVRPAGGERQAAEPRMHRPPGVWLADADDARPQGRRVGGNGTGQCPAGPGGVAGGLADAAVDRRIEGVALGGGVAQGDRAQGKPRRTAEPRDGGRLADANGRDTSAEREQRGRQQRQQPEDGSVGRVADAESGGGSVQRRNDGPAGQHGSDGHRASGRDGVRDHAARDGESQTGDLAPHGAGSALRRPGAADGFWRDPDWLLCRDGKWRAVKSGTFPLVNGSTNRVGRLRGYGNALVAPAAQAFVESVMEVIDETEI